MLSDQSVTLFIDISRASDTAFVNRVPRTAAINSILGMDIALSGATRVFEAIIRQDTDSSVCVFLAYITAAYASLDASTKV